MVESITQLSSFIEQIDLLTESFNMVYLMMIFILLILAGGFALGLNKDTRKIEKKLDRIEDDARKISEIHEKRVRGLSRTHARQKFVSKIEHDLNNDLQLIQTKEENKMELCPSCGISMMKHWNSCYHCGYIRN